VFRYALFLLLLILLAVVLQQFLPAFQPLYNARIFLLLVVFLCISVTVPLPVVFIYALICGFLWDAQCALSTDKLDLSVFPTTISSLRFGTSILLFGLAGAFMHGFQHLFIQGKWYVSSVIAGVATFIYNLVEYSLVDFIRGSFTVNRGVLQQIGYTSLFSALVAPLVFAALFLIARIADHQIIAGKRPPNRFGYSL